MPGTSTERAGGAPRRFALLALVPALAGCGPGSGEPIRPQDAAQVARGATLYARHCAACHGANLEGQPDWRRRRPDGRLPAPPHDADGHTWHHPNEQLVRIVRNGLKPPDAPPDYASDMPAFGSVLREEEIHAVLAYIQSRWPAEVWEARTQRLGQAR